MIVARGPSGARDRTIRLSMMNFTEDAFPPLYGAEEPILCRCRYAHSPENSTPPSNYKT